MNDKSETNTTIASRSESQNDINIIPDPLPIEQKEIVLDNKIILDSVVLYNKLSSKFDKSLEKLNNDEKENTKMLLESSIFMLNGKKINKIANLEIYEKLEELYLNNNFITEICGLEHLKSLQVLNLKNNYIKEIKNIKHLSNLQILDLSDNEIEEFNCNEIPTQNLFYAYFFDNPFFNKISFLEYRSKIIQKCEKIERIDKLDVKDREKLILIDEGNLKLKFSLKCLNYINTHYESLKNEKSSKIKKINDSIQGDFDNVNNKNKYKEQGNEKINFSSTLNNEENNKNNTKISEQISNLQKQSDEFMSSSLLSLQEKSTVFSKKSRENKKKFMESETVKELKKQIEILSEKFKKTNFTDPKVKEAFQQKIKNAINFQQRILNAETYAKGVIQKLTSNTAKDTKELPKKQMINKEPLELIKEKENEDEIIISTSKKLLENEDEKPQIVKKEMVPMNKEIIIEEQKNSSMTNQKQPDKNKHDNPLLSDSDLEDEEEKIDK